MLNTDEISQSLLDLHKTMFRLNMDESGPFYARAAFCSRWPENIRENPGHRYTGITNELVYFARTEALTAADFRRLAELAFSEALSQIKPSLRHRLTDVTLFVLCQRAESEAAAAVGAYRQRVSFKLSLCGTMELRAYVVDCGSGVSYANRWGRSLKKYLDKQILIDKVNPK